MGTVWLCAIVMGLAPQTNSDGAARVQAVERSAPIPSRPSTTDMVPAGDLPAPQPTAPARVIAGGVEFRTIDGSGNNLDQPGWGSAGTRFLRSGPYCYADGVSAPAGPDRPSPRAISNALCAQSGPMPNSHGATDFVWMWGQFLDHDLALTPTASPTEPFPISVPAGDAHFDPSGTGTVTISLDRSTYDPASGTDANNPREQVNVLTAYIDASNVYGSDTARASWLRTNDGTGRLKTSAGDLLPYNADGLPNAGGTGPELFLAGDVRANEQVSLTALHTLFVREHNRLADEIGAANPSFTDDEIYQRARAVVGAQMQVITYKEFLPVLLGPGALSTYSGYDPSDHPGIDNVFTTACYRVGHTMLAPSLRRLNADATTIAEGDIALRDAFFAPTRLTDGGGIEPLFRGAAAQLMQQIDPMIVEDVRSFLFGPPGAGGFDLASLNIQRGRDHGLSTYNETCVAFGLPAATTFSQITSEPNRMSALQGAYADVDKVDLWVGALAEDHVPGAIVGQLLYNVLKDQFERLRDGDRFWYQNVFSGSELAELENTRLADIIRRNTAIGDEIQNNVFVAASAGEVPAASEWGLMILALILLTTGSLLLRDSLGIRAGVSRCWHGC